MKKTLLLVFAIAVVFFALQQKSETATEPLAKPIEEAELRTASAKAIKLIQHAQADWYKKETCASCHNQLLPEFTFKLARERGMAIDEAAAREETAGIFGLLKDFDVAVQGYDYIDAISDGWTLMAAHAAGVRPNLATSAYAQLVASHQREDGGWRTTDARPPQSFSRFTATAVCAQGMQLYMPARLKHETQSRLARARAWLLKATPRSTEDRVWQLLGLQWTGADQMARQNAARQLLAEQREDGGWSQLAALPSDAYSTGAALVALHEGAGLPTDDPAYQRGLRYLLKTQAADGSWHVTSRLHPPAPVSPPYFESGFPYGHDQFISLAGSSWATVAMLHAVSAKAVPPRMLADFAPAENAEWMEVALTGSAADLKRLLDAGMKPDSKTAGGTTALMMAARDLEKVKLLVARGADVNAHAATGITPLMAAAQYPGNVAVVRFLLQKGARPTNDKGIEVRYNASPAFYAVMAFDTQTLEALREAGASLNERMKIIGRFSATPLIYAVGGSDPTMVDYLLSKGANPNEADDDGISILGWAAIINRPAAIKALLARGADVNHADRFGMTPLLYAASIDFGDTEVLETLIAAGADLKVKNKQGQTAADLARGYNYAAMASRLSSKAAAR
ncbi:MAG TPA: ankyrin repeat domain-containing protein [Blastocatellia bacterium]|nr:ankyrin repeat domain-containing protein [Blastocatellia bacterium]